MNISTIASKNALVEAFVRRCPRAAYEAANQQGSPSLEVQSIFTEGNIVDQKSQEILFPDGETVPFSKTGIAIEATNALLVDISVGRINQPTLKTPEGEVVRLDSIERTKDSWSHEEVKSALSVKPKHRFDALVSTDRATRAGLMIGDVELVHLNRDWRVGDSELDLFRTENITTSMSDQSLIEFLENTKVALMSDEPPLAKLVKGCWSGTGGCPYFVECFGYADHPLIELSRVNDKQADAFGELDSIEISDIPSEFKLTSKQRQHTDLIQGGVPIINRSGLEKSLSQIQSPVHHLDFEAVAFAVPLHTDVQPWGHVASQYSIHIEAPDGLVHREFLWDSEGDQRRILAERLIEDLGEEGTIVVWNVAFEKGRIQDMARWFSDLAPQLEALIPRLFDVWPVTKSNVQHPDFCGSYSLKAVAPILVPGFSYDDLDISGGGDAGGAMNLMMRGKIVDALVPVFRERLLRYCERDTEATVGILQALRDMVVESDE
jgi:hypothetical protein